MFVRAMVVFGLVLALNSGVSSAYAAKEGKKKGSKPIAGVVTAVDDNSITVQVHAKKKDKGAAPADGAKNEKKIQVNKETKFALAAGKKKDAKGEQKPADLKAVKKGERVVIFEKSGQAGTAERVLIRQGKKEKKNKNT